MKKVIVLLALICCLLCGCSMTDNEQAEKFGRFCVLEYQGQYFDDMEHRHYQYLVYDEATYIIYVYDIAKDGVSISPYYCMNADNEPEIAVYWDGME